MILKKNAKAAFFPVVLSYNEKRTGGIKMKGKTKFIFAWLMALIMTVTCCMVSTTGVQAKAAKAGKLMLNMKTLTMQVGDRMNLKVTQVTPSSASKKVTWKTSNKKVVSVTKSGVIRAKRTGSATITARSKNGKATVKCKIIVNENAAVKSKTLVAYFSATETTKGIAEKIAKASGGDLYRIIPAKKYTSKDLNYNNDSSRAAKEQNNKKARPAMKGNAAGIQNYDVIFVGFPIWFDDAPRIISTFMESYSFAGKTVIPFCTSGSSGISNAAKTLKNVTKGNVSWRIGRRFDADASQAAVTKWVSDLNLQAGQSGNNPVSPTDFVDPSQTSGTIQNPLLLPSQTPESTPESSVSPMPTDTPDNSPSQNPPDTSEQPENKVLVAYFSATGSTKGIAEKIAAAAGAELYEIQPEIPYTSEDLNYNSSDSRANAEQNDSSARPGITGSVANMEQYSTIFLGYPIWWGQAPKIMYTFVEQYNLSGKTIIPFCTSGSSGIGTSATNLQAADTNQATWLAGRRFSGSAPDSEVTDWISGLGLQ